ncbi:MAG: GNAT family N-acetyltransferase [Gemmatimonadetes bacterium]|nr:GNAT family N-acetyltransferase [Gemmatimonadota bacterium]
MLRRWTPADARALKAAVDVSVDHLRPWMPWAAGAPFSLAETEEHLAGFEAAFDDGDDFAYGILSVDESEVIGSSGLHRRIGSGGLEIGYWVRVDRTRLGYATEAARALTEAGLAVAGVDRVEIHCDPTNVSSRRIPERLGYRLVETRRGDKVTPTGEARDTVVFRITATDSSR